MIPTRQEWEQALIKRHGKKCYEKLVRSKVAVCGLGGLGSNVANALVRAGIGELILIDFDSVDVTNLHRQQYKANQVGMLKTEALAQNLYEINPYAKLTAHTVKLTTENTIPLLKDADLIIEAFDRPDNKAMLTNLVLENLPDTYLVAASGMAGFDDPNLIQTRHVFHRFYLCGDGVSEVSDDSGLVSARVMLCAAHEALTAIRLLCSEST